MESKTRNAALNLIDMFLESHQEEMDSGHHGDSKSPGADAAGCSYCRAIRDMKRALTEDAARDRMRLRVFNAALAACWVFRGKEIPDHAIMLAKQYREKYPATTEGTERIFLHGGL